MFLNKAIAEAVYEEMQRSENVCLLGEDILNLNGAFSHYIGVPQAFPDRCLDMPIAELGYAQFGTGAAMIGMRPIVELMFTSFTTLACDAIINVAAKYRYCTMGRRSLPVVYMMANGSRGMFGSSSGCNHNQCLEQIYHNVPGLKILMPFYPADAKGLLKSAIRDDDPVVFMYHLGALGMRGSVPEDPDYVIPIQNAANIIREGKDATVIGIHAVLPGILNAAETLSAEGIDIEVIDPRVLVPLDKEKIVSSARKTGRVLIAHEAPVTGGIGGEISAVIAESCLKDLKAPIRRLGQLATPGPVGPSESMMQPKAADVVRIVKELMQY